MLSTPQRRALSSVVIQAIGSQACWIMIASAALAASPEPADRAVGPEGGYAKALAADEWSAVDDAVQRALAYLASRQERDGSFATLSSGQPGVTGLAVMAFLSAGHRPGEGPYAAPLTRAIDFALDCQQPGGLLALEPPPARVVRYNGAHTAFYNHGITGLMLGEAYGMTSADQSARIAQALPRAIDILRDYQFGKRRTGDQGGWRYFYNHSDVDSDMSCTAWQLMLLRSARNAEFDVPEETLDDAMAYVQRCFDPQRGYFRYGLYGGEQYPSGGSVGGAIVSLSMAGRHDTEMARTAARWVLDQPVDRYNAPLGPGGNYHYGVYYGSQATFQLGGEYWRQYYPRVVRALVANQNADGSWPPDAGIASPFGSTYSTALAVLALTPPYQLLPIYQR